MDTDRVERRKKRAIVKRSAIIDRIKSIYDTGVAGESNEDSRQHFLISVNELSNLWDKFVIENDSVLEAMIELDEVQNFSTSEELEMNRILTSAKVLANRFSSPTVSKEQSVPPSGSQSDTAGISGTGSKSNEIQPEGESTVLSSPFLRLPQIPLPYFEGELADWPDFRDRFTALVHSRSNISNVEKFYYLVGCLSSDASEAIKGIMVSSETYEIAWAALVERYDKPRKLASRLLESMFSATPITHNESVISLNKFLNIYDENIAILNSLEIPDLGDFIFFSLAFRALPTTSRRLFETTNQEVYPQSQDLFKFVRNRVQVLELAGGGSSPPVLKNPSFKSAKFGKDHFQRQKPKATTSLLVTKSAQVTSADDKKCVSCGGSHLLKSCPVFKGLSLSDRFEIVSKNRLCMSCFSNQHWSNKCSESCSICKRRHHFLLHQERKSDQTNTAQQPSAVLLGSRSNSSVLLGTALVLVRDAEGVFQPVRALLDSGSQISAISKKVSDQLGLRRSRWTASVTEISGHLVPEVSGTVQLST